MKIDLGQYSKAIGVLILGVYAWGNTVVDSPRGDISAKEWMALGGVASATFVTYVLKNAKTNTGEDNG